LLLPPSGAPIESLKNALEGRGRGHLTSGRRSHALQSIKVHYLDQMAFFG
jgi:hypothetical protein